MGLDFGNFLETDSHGQGRTQDFKLGGAGDKRIFFFQIRIHIVLINY